METIQEMGRGQFLARFLSEVAAPAAALILAILLLDLFLARGSSRRERRS